MLMKGGGGRGRGCMLMLLCEFVFLELCHCYCAFFVEESRVALFNDVYLEMVLRFES